MFFNAARIRTPRQIIPCTVTSEMFARGDEVKQTSQSWPRQEYPRW